MAKRKLWLGLFACCLVFGMALSSCSDEVKSGTIQIEITDIPTEVMTEARSRGFYAKLIRADAINGEDGSFPPAALLTVWDAKRCPSLSQKWSRKEFKFEMF